MQEQKQVLQTGRVQRRKWCIWAVLACAPIAHEIGWLVVALPSGQSHSGISIAPRLAVSSTISLVLAGIAFLKIWKRPDLRGLRLAIVAVAVSVVFLLLFPMARKADRLGMQMECGERLKNIDSALMTYVKEHNGQLPAAAEWREAIAPYVKDPASFHCPAVSKDLSSYAMNSAIDPNLAANPSDVVLIFECKPGSQESGGKEMLDPRHSEGCWTLYPDLHIEMTCLHVIDRLRWSKDEPAKP